MKIWDSVYIFMLTALSFPSVLVRGRNGGGGGRGALAPWIFQKLCLSGLCEGLGPLPGIILVGAHVPVLS